MSDFGTSDPFVGTMKGVIMNIHLDAKIVDLSHEISPFNIIMHGAIMLQTSYKHFPPETIFVTIVDPTVGSDRKGILMEADGFYFIGPDNGILWPILKTATSKKITHIQNSRYFQVL